MPSRSRGRLAGVGARRSSDFDFALQPLFVLQTIANGSNWNRG